MPFPSLLGNMVSVGPLNQALCLQNMVRMRFIAWTEGVLESKQETTFIREFSQPDCFWANWSERWFWCPLPFVTSWLKFLGLKHLEWGCMVAFNGMSVCLFSSWKCIGSSSTSKTGHREGLNSKIRLPDFRACDAYNFICNQASSVYKHCSFDCKSLISHCGWKKVAEEDF